MVATLWLRPQRRAGCLRQHAPAVQPDYPSAAERADDFSHHTDLRERLDRAARALTRR
jgi:hypothetical protein